jgi:hypothetical protein
MAVAQGYGKTVTSGSVFAYDTGDTRNSYKGQPTVNAFGAYPTDLYGWVNGGNQVTLSRDTIPSPVGNTPLKMVCNGNDPYISTYGGTGNNIAAASSGQTWTISVWAKANQNTTGAIFHFGANSSGNIIDFNAIGISLTTEWTRYTYTRTFTDGNVVAIQARLDGPDSFQSGVVIWWDGLQVEQKAYATQFVAGTRSATQGLLPVIGNSTLDLTNMSFDSSAKMVFDGTNDYIPSIGTALVGAGSSPYTVSLWVYRERNNASYEELLSQWTYGNSGNSFFFGFENSSVRFTDSWPTVTVSGAGATGVWMNLVGINTGTDAYIYLNGSLAATKGSPFTYTGTGNMVVGRQGEINGEYFLGKIDKVEILNRALTAQEVKQNYQQHKTRFNLS